MWLGPGYTVWRSEKQLVNDSGWGYYTFDMAQFVDGAPSVRFEFAQTADESGQYSGWTVDDFIIKDGSLPDYGACSTCGGQPSFTGATSAIDNDACGADGVTVSWDDVVAWGTGGGGTFAVYRGETPDFVPGSSNLVASGLGGRSYVDSAAPTDRELWYVVRAESDESCGSGPANSGVMDANLHRVRVRETTDRPAPTPVSGLVVTLLGDVHVRLGWDAAAEASGGYRVYRSTSPDGAGRALLGETSALVFDDHDSGANRVNYYYDVVAINACGDESE